MKKSAPIFSLYYSLRSRQSFYAWTLTLKQNPFEGGNNKFDSSLWHFVLIKQNLCISARSNDNAFPSSYSCYKIYLNILLLILTHELMEILNQPMIRLCAEKVAKLIWFKEETNSFFKSFCITKVMAQTKINIQSKFGCQLWYRFQLLCIKGCIFKGCLFFE